MTLGVVVVAGLLGVLLGPLLRGQIFRHAVPAGRPGRRNCPYCGVAVGVVLALTGRCPHCRRPVGPRAGLVEVVAATVFAALTARIGDVLPLLAYLWIAVFGILLGFVDVAVRRLPDRLTLAAGAGPVVLLGLAAVTSDQLARYGVAAVCALAVAGAYLGLVVFSPGGLGPGDAKLAFALGSATGWYGWTTAFHGALAGLLLASGHAAILLLLRRIGRHDQVPHGPAMLTGALAAVLLAA